MVDDYPWLLPDDWPTPADGWTSESLANYDENSSLSNIADIHLVNINGVSFLPKFDLIIDEWMDGLLNTLKAGSTINWSPYVTIINHYCCFVSLGNYSNHCLILINHCETLWCPDFLPTTWGGTYPWLGWLTYQLCLTYRSFVIADRHYFTILHPSFNRPS